MPGAVWFPGAHVNFARQVFRHVAPATAAGVPALIAGDETGTALTLSWIELRERVQAQAERFTASWIPEGATGQIHRVARRFAVVAAAGEIATAAGITGWPEGEAACSAKACFQAWLAERGGVGNIEETRMLQQVRRFLEQHGNGRFTDWDRPTDKDSHAPRTLYRAGVRRAVKDAAGDFEGWEYYVLPETFQTEICDGYDYKAVARVLLAREALRPDKGRAFDCNRHLPDIGKTRCYRITPGIFSEIDE